MSKELVAIYPGSFDPITNGHLDLIARASHLVDCLIVGILRNERKKPLFSVGDRMEMLREVTPHLPKVRVECFEGLLVDFASSHNASLIIRGIRAISDYEYEWQMALMNKRLRPEIETVFLMANEAHAFVSSHLVKEVVRLGGDISDMVPPFVESRLKQEFCRIPV